ncbi:S-layer homology domain-containing protein [Candidatus Peregrinibacteria bacterium]|nr:S-layer homology domain-containing protein [Candidatus Peregrinibacteria bacterium]
MCKLLKKWLVTKLIVGLIFGTALTSLATPAMTAQAFTLVEITNSQAKPDAFDPSVGQNTVISYCLNTRAWVNAGIYQASGTSSQKVAILASNESKAGGCYTVNWDGKNDTNSEIGTSGEIVDNGQYFFYIEAQNGLSHSTATDWITVGEGVTPVKFIDVQVDNPIFDPWDSQKATLNFTISKSGYITLQINDADNQKVAKLIDSKWYEKGEYTAYWNGEDDMSNKVNQDEYNYSIKIANGDEVTKKTGKLVVKKGYNSQTAQTEDPRIENFYTTKEEFDPGRKEKEFIVFNLTAKADVQVSVYDKDDKFIKKLYNKIDQAAGTYTIQWDGQEALNKDATYTYRIYAKNAKGEDTRKGKIKVAEDRSDTSRANVFKDMVDSIIFNPNDGEQAVNFTLEKDAKVTVEIRDEKHLIATLTKDNPYAEGTQTVYWDGKDKYGKMADDGQYMYRVTAKNNAGKEVEEGNFTVQKIDSQSNVGNDCSQFKDVDNLNQYCKAIEWSANQGIFQGYNDGSFKPNKAISRAEALKVILKTTKIQLISPTNNIGFTDTNSYEWYATFVQTAVSLGIVHGYQDGSFKPNQIVTHSEAQIMIFRAANSKGQFYPENSDYSPNTPMTRAEMADLLYKYYQNTYQT